jgi:hypothetical protein
MASTVEGSRPSRRVFIQDLPKAMTVFQTSVLIRRSKFYRECKVEMKEHMLEIVHKLCPENHLR